MRLEIPNPGEIVGFVHDGEMTTGICNGDPKALGDNETVITHVPIYVREGDKCLLVAVSNIRSIARRLS